MNLKPVDHRILVKFHFPDDSGIQLPDSRFEPNMEEKRTKVEVLAVGENVTVCKPGDFLLVFNMERGMLPTTKEPPTGLIHDSMVLGIILDDKPNEPTNPTKVSNGTHTNTEPTTDSVIQS